MWPFKKKTNSTEAPVSNILEYKEFSNGKLYHFKEASKISILKIKDTFDKHYEIKLGEAIEMCRFPKEKENNLNNLTAFLLSCESAGILPRLDIYVLSSRRNEYDNQFILFISGTFDERIKYGKMFNLPAAESIFKNMFHSNDWSLINPKSSVGNVAEQGFRISSLDTFNSLLESIWNGDFIVNKVITPVQKIQKLPLEFKILSLDIKQSHQYGDESSKKTITASASNRILIVKFIINNNSDKIQRFSSQQFSILDGKGKNVDASFYGVGNNIAESGARISIESKVNNAEGIQIMTFKGKLSEDVSFIEWELAAHQSYEDTFVYLIPAKAQDVVMLFSHRS
ncbi:MAG: DUF4352 domain-containing protein [Bacteroidetes bacterium]|nr:MAG: DUF4352 domain-containing protein [Bacteroidota bacterium]